MNVLEFDSLESTNKYFKDNAEVLSDFDVIFCHNQTDGKGRENRKWISDSGSLTFSICLKNDFAIENFSSVSLLTAAAVFNVISKYAQNVTIKWPNDILVSGRKICGILLEAVTLGRILGITVGIGVNVNNELDLLSCINDKETTSLFLETGKKFDVDVVLLEILAEFKRLYDNLSSGGSKYLDIVRKNNFLKGKIVFSPEFGCLDVIDISNDNKLLCRKDNRIIEISTGEVSITNH